MEYEVAGSLLVLASLDSALLNEIDRLGWLEVPLIDWKTVIKPLLDAQRRSGMCGSIRDDTVYGLRKIISVTYRRDTEADWVKERMKRSGMSYYKRLVAGGSYRKKFFKRACAFEDNVASKIASRPDHAGLDEWWARRHHHIPGGSTSAGAWARKLFADDPRSGKNDRPGKKSVVEALPAGLMQLLLAMPRREVARASTKHEPGDKRRALYATNDIHYLISAYASVHAEKSMDVPGCCARQTPEDFATWVASGVVNKGYWLSADMSDYNGEHEKEELVLMNCARAMAWSKRHDAHSQEKTRCALWLAEAQYDSWVEYPDTGMTRSFSGLYSGSRDTQRDNTTKHVIDVEIIKDDCMALGYPIAPVGNGYPSSFESGDDEDTLFSCIEDAIVYVSVLGMSGHDTNDKKQLAGCAHHEFLQVVAYPSGTLQRPLASLIATLATGNWYVPSATWYGANITGLSDNWWEAAVRGLAYPVAFHLACAYLDTIMRVPVGDTGYKELEWWSYRSGTYAHPLWKHQTCSPPVIRDKPESHVSWPEKATEAWLDLHSRVLAGLSAEKIALYRESLLQSSHGSAFLEYRQRDLRKRVADHWPARISRTYVCPAEDIACAFSAHEMHQFYGVVGQQKLPLNEGELAARLGVDPEIVGLRGGWSSVGRNIPGERWSHYAPLAPVRSLGPRASSSSWAFRSWAARTDCSIRQLHNTAGYSAQPHKIVYVYAANGAGKSWLVDRFSHIKDLDRLAGPISEDKPRAGTGLDLYAARHQFLARLLKRAVAEGAYAVCGQWDPNEVCAAARRLNIPVHVLGYEPGVDIRKARLRARGWSDDKIQRRANRWVWIPESADTWQELVMRIDAHNAGAIDIVMLKNAAAELAVATEAAHKIERIKTDLLRNSTRGRGWEKYLLDAARAKARLKKLQLAIKKFDLTGTPTDAEGGHKV